MKKEELLIYNRIQLLEMDRHKWIESEKAGMNLGDIAYLDWIRKHSKKFREEWETASAEELVEKKKKIK